MPLTSPYAEEALDHRARPDPLDDLIRSSPPRERLVARATAIVVAAFLLAALFTPIEYSTALSVVVAEQRQANSDAGRVLLRVNAAAVDDASRDALAVLPPGAAVTLVFEDRAANGRLLSVSAISADAFAVDVQLSFPTGFGIAATDHAVLRFSVGSRSVAAALPELVSPTASE